MKIHCFGDSWTEGIGVEWEPGNGAMTIEQRYHSNWKLERCLYSWPGQLQSLLKNKYIVNNFAQAGYSNFQIYETIIKNLENNKIEKNDLVIICFSSIIREPLNFLANGFINYSNVCHIDNQKYPHWISNIENDKLKKALINNYEEFLVNRINYNFLYEIAMNYVCNLQTIFETLDIKYIFMNAFENIVSDNIFFYNQIKKENWILFNYTLSEYLLKKSAEIDNGLSYSLWEDDCKDVRKCSDGPHPNRIGYKYIAELVCDEIIKRNIL